MGTGVVCLVFNCNNNKCIQRYVKVKQIMCQYRIGECLLDFGDSRKRNFRSRLIYINTFDLTCLKMY